MEKYYFDEKYLMTELQTMSYEQVLAFCASCCERLLPNYRKFVESEGWGDYGTLRSVLDHVWKIVFRETNVSDDTIKTLYAKVDKLTPDMDDFGDQFGSYALDAGCAILETLEYSHARELSWAIAVATKAIATVDMFVFEKINMPNSEPKVQQELIANDPVMFKEVKKQIDDLKTLKAQSEYNVDFLKQFQQLVYNNSNVEL